MLEPAPPLAAGGVDEPPVLPGTDIGPTADIPPWLVAEPGDERAASAAQLAQHTIASAVRPRRETT
jgi:hypothetical protein